MKNIVEGITATIGLSHDAIEGLNGTEGLVFALIEQGTYLSVSVNNSQELVFHRTPLATEGAATRTRKSLMDALCDGTFNSIQATCLTLRNNPDAQIGELGEMWANACLLHEEAASFDVSLHASEFQQPSLTLH